VMTRRSSLGPQLSDNHDESASTSTRSRRT
jgi:hypothetical protein